MTKVYVVFWPETGRLAFPKNCDHSIYYIDKDEAEVYAKKCNSSMGFISKLFAGGWKWSVKTLDPAKVNK